MLHCGERTEGFFLTTLSAVDVASGWSEFESLWGMGKHRVGAGIEMIRRRLPFPLRELHTDNGGEFINHVLVPWCAREGIRFTRGRSYRKNDQAYVEQRNWQGVRREVGYDRYSSRAAHQLLRQLYPLLALRLNFFRPLRKVVAKERVGSRVRKRYDAPLTPYQRLLRAGVLGDVRRAAVERQLSALNPAALQRQIDTLLRRLWQLGDQREQVREQQLG